MMPDVDGTIHAIGLVEAQPRGPSDCWASRLGAAIMSEGADGCLGYPGMHVWGAGVHALQKAAVESWVDGWFGKRT